MDRVKHAGMRQIGLTYGSCARPARAFHRVLKLSRAITDLAGSYSVEMQHLAEALQYHPRLSL